MGHKESSFVGGIKVNNKGLCGFTHAKPGDQLSREGAKLINNRLSEAIKKSCEYQNKQDGIRAACFWGGLAIGVVITALVVKK